VVSISSSYPRDTVVYTHRECFDEAATRFDPPVEKVEIPYEETTLSGYLFKVDNSGRSPPPLLLNMGSDGDATGKYLDATRQDKTILASSASSKRADFWSSSNWAM
jgi:hypothetical protein